MHLPTLSRQTIQIHIASAETRIILWTVLKQISSLNVSLSVTDVAMPTALTCYRLTLIFTTHSEKEIRKYPIISDFRKMQFGRIYHDIGNRNFQNCKMKVSDSVKASRTLPSIERSWVTFVAKQNYYDVLVEIRKYPIISDF